MKYVTAYVTKEPAVYTITFKKKAESDTTLWVCYNKLAYDAAMDELRQIESVQIVSHGQKHHVYALPCRPLLSDEYVSLADLFRR